MLMTAEVASLQERQKENLLKLLDFNSESASITATSATEPDTNAEKWGDQWKVLIYDRFCRDILSPILKLHELRRKGVTLHMLLDSERDEIPDVPAIYFVQPTSDNIHRIVQDCTKEMYSSAHLNFSSPLSRESLELLAKLSVEAGCTSMIAKVYDQYTNFISLEPNLFTLNLPNSYAAYNDPSQQDVVIERTMGSIVQGIFSVLATLGTIPVIRCPSAHGPARMVAEQLDNLIREQLIARQGVFSDTHTSYQRPVLILMDRNEDLTSMLHHPSTYQALVDDMLKINMNRVKVPSVKSSADGATAAGHPPSGGAGTSEKTYDLDVKTDRFFELHAGSLFPDAIDANEEEMKQVTRKEEAIRARTGASNDTVLNGTKDLAAAVDTLPALVEKKKVLEVHTNIFQAAFDHVTKRHIPSFSMLEQKLIDGGHVDKSEILPLLATQNMGTSEDKMRLLMIYFLTSGASSAEMAEFETAVPDRESFANAWRFVKKHTALQKHASVGTSLRATGNVPTHSHETTPPGSSGGVSKFRGLAQGFLAQAAASVKNFLPENKKLHLTRVTDAICDMKPGTEDDFFLYLDPKIKGLNGGNVPRQRAPFREAIVFMIGGGNYNEFCNLMAYTKAQTQTPRKVLYGCTELLNPSEFLHQMNKIMI